jgi:hypothetical protein
VDPSWFRVATLSKPWGGGGAGAEGVLVAPGRSLLVYEQYPEDDASSNPRARARYLTTPPRSAAPVPPTDGGGDAGADGSTADADAGADMDMEPTRAGGGGCDCALASGPRSTFLAAPALALLLVMLLRSRACRTV